MQQYSGLDTLILIAPDDSGQGISDNAVDCDCACASAPPSGARGFAWQLGATVRLHPQARFAVLDGDYELLYIPSSLAGVVVNRAARAWLCGLRQPTSASAAAPTASQQALLERCVALGILIGDTPPAQAPRTDTLSAWLHVTNACNLRCTYCYLHKTEEPMSAATGFAAVDAIIRSAVQHSYQAIKLKYAGGEAALNFPLVQQLHEYALREASRHGLRLTEVLLSNGVGLPTARLRMLRDQGIRLMISLDGMAETHNRQRVFVNGRGSFQSVAGTIERALAIGLVPNISVTITGQTAAGLADTVRWLLDRELPFNLNFYRENDHSSNFAELQLDEQCIIAGMLAAFRVIEARMPRRSMLSSLTDRANLAGPHSQPCGVGSDYLVIDQNGGVAKCQMQIEQPITSIAAPDPLGLIREDTIGVRNVPVQQKQGCRDCEWQLWCAGGCPVATFRATGRYDVKSPNCTIYKALYPEAVRLEGLRVLKYGTPEVYQHCSETLASR